MKKALFIIIGSTLIACSGNAETAAATGHEQYQEQRTKQQWVRAKTLRLHQNRCEHQTCIHNRREGSFDKIIHNRKLFLK
mgnify:CR=1 FL=1